MNLANPMNTIPLRLLTRLFGISTKFWEEVFVGVHSSSFLTTNMDQVPAFIAPTVEDMITLQNGGTMTTWQHTSNHVFEHLVAQVAAAGRLYTNTAVNKVYSTGPNTYGFEATVRCVDHSLHIHVLRMIR